MNLLKHVAIGALFAMGAGAAVGGVSWAVWWLAVSLHPVAAFGVLLAVIGAAGGAAVWWDELSW